MVQRSLILVILIICFAKSGLAQYDNEIYLSDTGISPADSQQLFLRFGNATFIKNNEYFNPYQPGYTLLGFYMRPMLEYYPGPKTRITAGVHLLKYSGLGRYSQAIPVFSFHHRFSPGMELVVGTLYGTANHALIEPLFSYERVFTNHNESGLQLLANNKYFKSDLWLNWERFIFAGDPFQEEFTAGLSSLFFTGERDSRFRVDLPLQLMVMHRGGQIDASEERMQNMVNFATGFHADWRIDDSFIESISLRGYFAAFRDFSTSIENHYDKGWGIYPNIIVKTRWLDGGLGYWSGHRFVAPRGEPVFQSVSRVDPDFTKDNRELVTSRLIFNKELLNGINMGIRFAVFYDMDDRYFDHSAGLHIIIDQRFFLTHLQKR